MKKIVIFLSLLITAYTLSAYHFWDFETDPWADGWNSAKRIQGQNWPRRWQWRVYDQEAIRPLDPLTMSMWICSNRAGNYVLRDTLYSPKISDSLFYTQWLKYSIGYNYRAGRDRDTASILIRSCAAGAWTNWQQLKYYYGTDLSIWDSVDISSYAMGYDTIQLGFAYRGGGGSPLRPDFYLGLDNISIMTFQGGNIPGPTTAPLGTDSGLVETNYVYTSEVVPGDYEYQFSWGDGGYSAWDISTSSSRSWTTPGTYFVQTRIRDANDSSLVSNWSPPLLAVMVTPKTAYYWGFEVDDGGFVGLHQLGDWQWGIPLSGPFRARSGGNVWATRLNENYYTNASWLNTPEVNLSMCDSVILDFWMWYDSRQDYDGVNLWVGSASFTWGLNNAGYYWDTVPSASIVPAYTGSYNVTWTSTTMPGWTGSNPIWTLYQVDLTPYKYATDLRLLWRLGDNDGTTGNRAGFYIDDIRLDTVMLIPGPTTAPTGPDTCITYNSYNFTSEVVAGAVEYQFDWGDGTYSGWNIYPLAQKTYDEVGTYFVRSRVRDSGDTTRLSGWSPEHLTVALHARTVYYSGFEFEMDTAGYYFSGDWQRGIPVVGPLSARSGVNVTATDLDGIYDQNASWFRTPDINTSFADSAVLFFWMWYESAYNEDGVDLFYGSASMPSGWNSNGRNWDTIPSENVNPIYTGTFNVSWMGATLPGWTGSSSNWTLYSVNLTGIKNYTDLQILWRLSDNNGTTGNGPGFYIDDIRVDTFMRPLIGPLHPPFGPTWGYVSTNYAFLSDSAITGMGTLEYQFSWGDSAYSSWSTDRNAIHQWSAEGLYGIRTRARIQSDTTLIGQWSPPHYIEVGASGYFDPPWTFEPGNQGWKISSNWERKSSSWYSGWEMTSGDNWSMWAIGTGKNYVCDTTFSPSAPVSVDYQYLCWTGCLRKSTSVQGDTAIVMLRTFRNTVWGDWEAVYFYTTNTNPNWFYQEILQLFGADSVQVGVIYTHREGPSYDRFFGIDNVWLLNRPYLEEVVWNFEDQAKWDWTHTVSVNWPNGWNIRDEGTVSSLELDNAGNYSAWIGNTSSHSTPLVDTIKSPAEWNPVDLQYFVWGIGFNNAYDSIKVLMCGLKEGSWTAWQEIKTYYRATTPSFRALDSADVSDSFANASKIEVAFAYYATQNYGACVIDNIYLSSSVDKDAFVGGGDPNIQGVFQPAGSSSIREVVKNNGTQTANFSVRAVVTDINSGSVLMNETRDVTGLSYLDSVIVDFGDVDLVEDHHYIKKIIIEYPGDANPHNDTSIYSVRCVTPSWEPIADMPIAVAGPVSWIDDAGDVNVFGDTLHMKYDATGNVWSVVSSIPYKITDAQGVSATDKVYMLSSDSSLAGKLIIFDKLTGSFQTQDLPNTVNSPVLAFFEGIGGDYIYVIESNLTEKPSCYFFDENSEEFMLASPLPGGFEGGLSVSSREGIALAGGDIYGGNVYFGRVSAASPVVINWSTDYRTPLRNTGKISAGSSGSYMVFAGGQSSGVFSANSYLYENGYGWYQIDNLPSPLSSASITAREAEGSSDTVEVRDFFLVGGRNSSGALSDAYRLVLKTKKTMGMESSSEAIGPSEVFSVRLASSNVFMDEVSIRLSLPGNSSVRWLVYDISGRQVREIETFLPAGTHIVSWDGKDDRGTSLSAGTYFWMLRTDFGSENGKFLHVR
ncbi:hypothetical protein JXA84_02245 [candidate division WOR-3 bacterium]|nr:hypothetical protein [candidate division WOR-3 bacterium]